VFVTGNKRNSLEDVGFIGRHLYNYSYSHHNHWSCCCSCLSPLVAPGAPFLVTCLLATELFRTITSFPSLYLELTELSLHSNLLRTVWHPTSVALYNLCAHCTENFSRISHCCVSTNCRRDAEMCLPLRCVAM
jgi:hypothetical protein